MSLSTGCYNICDVESNLAAGLSKANSVVKALNQGFSDEVKWYITALGNGHHTIANVKFGNYAVIGTKPEEENWVVGGSENISWVIRPVPDSADGKIKYTIETMDGNYSWALPNGQINEPVILAKIEDGKSLTEWLIDVAESSS